MATKDISTDKNQPKRKLSDFIILIVGAIVMVGSIVLLFAMSGKSSDTEKKQVAGDLSGLHVFPPIDFVDSIYYAKTVVSYDEENPKDVFYYEKDSLGMPTNKRVHEKHYYPGRKKYIEGNLAEGKQREGLWYAYHKNGNVQTMAHYVNGLEEGQYTVYYENGNVWYTGRYSKGKRVGKWNFYDEHERLVKTEDFDVKSNK